MDTLEDTLKEYKHVNLPLPDVYLRGGPEAFNRLIPKTEGTKNAIVIPNSVRAELVRHSTDERGGAADTLAYLRSKLEEAQKVESIDTNTRIARTTDIDLLFVEDQKRQHPRDSNFAAHILQDKQVMTFTNHDGYRFLTTSNVDFTELQLANKNVEEPEFLISNPEICQEGFVEGTNELYAKLIEDQTNQHSIPVEDASEILNGKILHPNQFVRFRNGNSVGYAMVTGDFERKGNRSRMQNQRLSLIGQTGEVGYENARYSYNGLRLPSVAGIKSLDAEQYLAFAKVLLDQNIEVVFLTGKAGCGKTVLAYASMMAQLLDFSKSAATTNVGGKISGAYGGPERNTLYEQGVILKSIKVVGGDEVGFLPGGLLDKLYDHLKPYEQAHKLMRDLNSHMCFDDIFLHKKRENRFGGKRQCEGFGKIENAEFELPDSELVELTYSGFMRGTSYSDTFLIVDEAQNFEPYVMQMIIQRAAVGSKIVVMGDPGQIDSPECTPSYNGLTWAIKEYLDKDYSALVNFSKSHRSQAAEHASKVKTY